MDKDSDDVVNLCYQQRGFVRCQLATIEIACRAKAINPIADLCDSSLLLAITNHPGAMRPQSGHDRLAPVPILQSNYRHSLRWDLFRSQDIRRQLVLLPHSGVDNVSRRSRSSCGAGSLAEEYRPLHENANQTRAIFEYNELNCFGS